MPIPPTSIVTHIDWEAAYSEHGGELTRYEEIIQSFEEEHRIQLTPGAVEILFVPLIEVLDTREKLDQRVVAETLRALFNDIAKDADPRDLQVHRRSSLSVIRAYWKNFCNIPPFCAAPTRERGR